MLPGGATYAMLFEAIFSHLNINERAQLIADEKTARAAAAARAGASVTLTGVEYDPVLDRVGFLYGKRE